MRARLAVLAVAGLVAALGVTAITASGAGYEAEVRITAQRLAGGHTEFALQQREADGGWSERLLPRARFFPDTATVGLWLSSTPLTVRAPGAGDDAAGSEVRIMAQRLADGRIEFALQQRKADGGWSERLLPQARFFPATATVGGWLSSTPLTVGPPEWAALVALYNATGGASWDSSTNWLSDRPLDEWHGVTTNGDGRVITLSLSGNELTGTLPARLANLTQLRELWLYSNELTGAIPPELGNLSNLEVLLLSSNELTGPLPTRLANLPKLRQLWLYDNALSGTIPRELGNLSNLEELSLGNNGLTGTIPPELGKLRKLRQLGLYRNALSGTIPPELGNLSNLERLSLFDNALSGTIPPELGNLSRLEELLLSDNALTGTIPPELGKLPKLTWLQLFDNALSGTIPPELGNLSRLEDLLLYRNALSGTIPPELGKLPKLRWLWLYGNQLSGCVPADLATRPDLDIWTDDLPSC